MTKRRPRFICNGCGIDVLETGHWYMADPKLWEKLGLGWSDNLCLTCLEKRLGRPVRPFEDITPIPVAMDGHRTLNSVAPKRLAPRMLELFRFETDEPRKRKRRIMRKVRR